MQKTFLLGVGCQKGGTTWMHQFLSQHPNVNMGFRKEYHVFDRLYIPKCITPLKAHISDIQKEMESAEILDKKNLKKWLSFYDDTENYYNYFQHLASDNDETHLVGDITPTYCGLPAKVYADIKQSLEKRGFKVKVVFLMRDPVERLWSSARMRRRKQPAQDTSENYEHERLSYVYKRYIGKIRTQYDKTIKNVESVFPSEDIHYEFYEQLFRQESIDSLLSFLDLSALEPNFDKKVNVSKKTTGIDKALLSEVANYYVDTYAFVSDKFGKEKMENLWPNYKYIK